MDQIRVAFGFYVCASTWAFAEYNFSRNFFWTLLIGLFAGCAVLNMWLPGLIIYGAWGTSLLLKFKFSPSRILGEGRKELIFLLSSLVVAAIVFLPWQFYIFHEFPVESTYEAQWNSRHISEALEHHEGPWYFYVSQMPMQFGKVISYLIPVGLLSLIAFSKNRELLAAPLFSLIVPYLFFSLFVQTRMPSYVYMSHFIIWLSFGSMITGAREVISIKHQFKLKNLALTFFISLICFVCVFKIEDVLSHDLLKSAVGDVQDYREKMIHNTEIYKKLDQLVPPNYVVFNCNSFENVEAMFYSHRTVYHWYPDQGKYDSLKQQHINMAAFVSHNEYQLPDYMRNDSSLLLINEVLK